MADRNPRVRSATSPKRSEPTGSEGKLETNAPPIAQQAGPAHALQQRPVVGYGLLAPAVVVVTAILALPVLWGVYESLFVTRRGRRQGFVGFGNYTDLLSDGDFWSSAWRSLIFVAGCVIVGTILALFFGSALYRVTSGLRFLRGLSIVPWLLSSIGAAVLFRQLFATEYGLPNLFLGLFGIEGPSWLGNSVLAMVVVILAQVWGDLPLSILVVLGGFLALDPDQLDAALVDGASGWQRFRFVMLPHLAAHVALSAVLLSYHALTSLGILLGLTGGGPGQATETLSLMLYDLAFREIDYGASLALMVIILLFNGLLTVGYVGLSKRFGASA